MKFPLFAVVMLLPWLLLNSIRFSNCISTKKKLPIIQSNYITWKGISGSTSFVSFLLPAMFLSRFAQSRGTNEIDATAELRINPVLNRTLEFLLGMEVVMIRAGVNFPMGGSRLVVAKKS